jgi:hypothetical protein
MLPLVTSVGRANNGPRASELWGALELPPRPALFLVVTAPVELGFASPIWRRTTGAAVGVGPAAAVGGTVRDGVGVPLPGVELYVEERSVRALSDERGRFTLRGLGKGMYTLRITRPGGAVVINDLVVPAESYDIILL